MCGIIGFTGNEPAKDIIIGGLERLEYRGYCRTIRFRCASVPAR